MENNVVEKMVLNGITPVVVLDTAMHAVPLANALTNGGISVAEVTFRTDAAKESIRAMKQTFPEMVVGAGTVLTVETAKEAMEAGAEFIVSPGFDEEVVRFCMEQGVLPIPGIATPSEAQAAMKLGLTLLKVYPAGVLGGTAFIKALADVYRHVKFMPSGGINEANMEEYLKMPCIAAVSGSFICPNKLIVEEKFDEIERLSREAVMKLHR